jgi:hypothetical protein
MRYVGKDFPLQDPTETADLTFDFSRHPEWEKWDCILSVVTAVSVVDGTDAGSAARISGNSADLLRFGRDPAFRQSGRRREIQTDRYDRDAKG